MNITCDPLIIVKTISQQSAYIICFLFVFVDALRSDPNNCCSAGNLNHFYNTKRITLNTNGLYFHAQSLICKGSRELPRASDPNNCCSAGNLNHFYNTKRITLNTNGLYFHAQSLICKGSRELPRARIRAGERSLIFK